jgi:hypothetical protein
MNETTLWLAHERTRELRRQAEEARRTRRGHATVVRSLLRSLRTER